MLSDNFGHKGTPKRLRYQRSHLSYVHVNVQDVFCFIIENKQRLET